VIYRTYLGLDVRATELRAVSLRRKGKGAILSGGRILSLPEGVLSPSVREPNILDQKRFIDAVNEVLDPLAGSEERIALSLPEAVGRVLLPEVETVFKSREEGVDILKWQLKTNMPVDPKEIQLDYQVLEKRETGRYRLAVAMMARNVLNQYEDFLVEAGYNPGMIDFQSLNLYNFFRQRLDFGEDFVLVGFEGGTLTLQYFQGRVPAFHRAREIQADPAHLFRELTRSMVGCQENFSGFRRAAVFFHSDSRDRDPFLQAVRSAFEREVVPLDPHLDRMAQVPLDLPPWQARGLVAAVGAAERMM
jgi:type IV pilus assembly protein PilM